MIELLTPHEMGRADAMTIDAGTPGIALMEKAGKAVADAVTGDYPDAGRIRVLAGPGNNGGDGFVAGRLLRDAGRTVDIVLLGQLEKLRGDAAEAARRWDGPVLAAAPEHVTGSDVIVDALFGAGLTRAVDGLAAELVDAVNRDPAQVVAVDLPSGVNGETGQEMGCAVEAERTVTFFRAKPGHYLFPGRGLCGRLSIADIGIPAGTLDDIRPQIRLNAPAVWCRSWTPPAQQAHKYARGHTVVVSGPMAATGAARLAADGALRVGSGLVTVASPRDALMVNACHLTAVMVRPFTGAPGLSDLLGDRRLNCIAIGPGAGVAPQTCDLVNVCLDSNRPAVLDADALSSFRSDPERLFRAIREDGAREVVLTPHEGEFSRLFADCAASAPAAPASKVGRARRAAERSGATIVLKGPDTVVAAPDGRAAINANAPGWLATAGTGDVLTGLVAGLLAQGLPAFEAAAMAVWLHGAAASRFGPGMIAEDLGAAMPDAFRLAVASL